VSRRIEGKKIVLALVLLVLLVLGFAFYRYFTIEPGEGVYGVAVVVHPHAVHGQPYWSR
jgi:hypothetical protein